MLGGAFICYEGAGRCYEALWPDAAHAHEATTGAAGQDPAAFEQARIASAIQTDFIHSAEIMALTPATVPEASFWAQAAVLALGGAGITIAVYGAVALLGRRTMPGGAGRRHRARRRSARSAGGWSSACRCC